MKKDERKITRFTVEILDNGYTTEAYGYNPYGADALGKNIRTSPGDVVTEFLEVVSRNLRVDAAKKAEQEKKDKEEKDLGLI